MKNLILSKKSVIGLLILAVLVSQAILVQQNISNKTKLSELNRIRSSLHDFEQRTHKSKHESNLQGMKIPNFLKENSQSFLQGKLKKNEPIPREYTLYFFFTPFSCNTCVDSEIKTWNLFTHRFEKNVDVVGITEQSYLLETLQMQKTNTIEFTVRGINELTGKLQRHGVLFTPAVVFAENRGDRIIYAFYPDPVEKSDEKFLAMIQRFIENDKQISRIRVSER